MHKRLWSSRWLKSIVAIMVTLTTTPLALGVDITINNDVATGQITDGSSIIVDGWVYDSLTLDPDDSAVIKTVYANKVKLYLFYQQHRPTPMEPIGSMRYQLDASLASFDLGPSVDTGYEGTVMANMPNQATTAVTPNCWFLRSEAILDLPENPNALVDWVEKDVSLVWTTGGSGGPP